MKSGSPFREIARFSEWLREDEIDEDACIRNWTDKIATPETFELATLVQLR